MNSTSLAFRRARRGAAWLDKKLGPAWRKRIDPNRLAMVSSCNCIIGQLEGDFYEGAIRLGIRDPRDGQPVYDRGFVADYYGEHGPIIGWADLDAAWREIVKEEA